MKPKWPMPPTLLFVSIASMVLLHFILPLMRVIPSPWSYAGIPPIIFGVAWNIWADQLFKKHQTTVKPHLEPTSLVSTGPFRFSRNPMYLGMVAISVGVAVLLGTLASMIVAASFSAILALKFIPMEEDAMERAFGDAWKEYKSRVRSWF